ncbi:MAG: molybdopterin molybdenumtransferase MoeA [Euryarchaeota archaeon]|nr:molybdopterin molybdenumtransferase MoeA [Euryarchaeota archaeon]MBU4607357.1 molybdopterin molybdenumtransferase MoeA [Euryarchaeota archaeon]MBV1729537.1 molybdopterin molybdenumtransferase MoeA [Methanobacterium sp.]MBV1754332.1 molybdopterin molybdenumtransferase MoeA [Methanobacterium sp.]
MGTEFLKIIDVSKAHNVVKNIFKRLYIPLSEKISLNEALFRVLSHDIHANMDLPPFDRSIMDGYAVKSQDTFGATEENPAILKLLEVIRAGSIPKKEVKVGFCSEITTGAPIPTGADGVIMVEFSQKNEEDIKLFNSSYPGQYIAARGSDIKKGELVLKEGTILSPDKIGVLSALGYSAVEVRSKLKVAVISTGNELILPEDDLEYGKIYDVNSSALYSALESYGTSPILKGIIPDEYTALKNAIKHSLEDADLIITSGGTSAGAGDVLSEVLDDIGEVMVHGISIKPGKPTIIGEVNNKMVIGLPGNPTAALIVLDVLMAPYLKNFSGYVAHSKPSDKIKLPMASRFHSAQGRMEYVLVKILEGQVNPILKYSGAITGLAEADGYIKISKTTEMILEGDLVEVSFFDDTIH